MLVEIQVKSIIDIIMHFSCPRWQQPTNLRRTEKIYIPGCILRFKYSCPHLILFWGPITGSSNAKEFFETFIIQRWNQTVLCFLSITRYFIVNLVIPCIIISSLSLFGFYMPADACEKVTLTITVLLSMMVFLLLVANILPDSSDGVPLISKYLLFVFFVNTIQVLIGNR